MEGLFENRPVLYGLGGTGLLMLVCAAQILPPLNSQLELVLLPSGVRVLFAQLVVISGTLLLFDIR